MENNPVAIDELPPYERAHIYALKDIANELRLLRDAWLAAPMQEINTLMLMNMKAQMGGGILPATGIIKGH